MKTSQNGHFLVYEQRFEPPRRSPDPDFVLAREARNP
jgi:hypothetical protein